MSSVRILSVAQCHESLLDSAEALVAEQWPLFMLASPVSDQYWDTLYREENLPFQQVAVATIAGEEQVIGLLSAIPFYFPEDAPLTDLPDGGWDAVLTQGATDTRKPTFVSALSVTVDPDFRGRGIPAQLITALKAAVAQAGLKGVVVPVRPTLKAQYPLQDFAEYCQWQTPQGEPFDPWIRTHVRLGGQIIKPAMRSMDITSSADNWSEWTGMAFPHAGQYIVPGALVPVQADPETDRVIYHEPNLWIYHPLAE